MEKLIAARGEESMSLNSRRVHCIHLWGKLWANSRAHWGFFCGDE